MKMCVCLKAGRRDCPRRLPATGVCLGRMCSFGVCKKVPYHCMVLDNDIVVVTSVESFLYVSKQVEKYNIESPRASRQEESHSTKRNIRKITRRCECLSRCACSNSVTDTDVRGRHAGLTTRVWHYACRCASSSICSRGW